MARKKHEDDDEAAAEPERAVSPDAAGPASPSATRTRRCGRAASREFVGQRKIAENMAVYVQAARKRGDALDHVLLSGPPGPGQDDARVSARAARWAPRCA